MYKISDKVETEKGNGIIVAINGYEEQLYIVEINKIVERYLTPPTADEVCRQLQLFWGNNYKVNVSITNQIFIESKKDKDGDSYIEWDGEKIYFDWMPCYPPHLITLIGRFYEGLEK